MSANNVLKFIKDKEAEFMLIDGKAKREERLDSFPQMSILFARNKRVQTS